MMSKSVSRDRVTNVYVKINFSSQNYIRSR